MISPNSVAHIQLTVRDAAWRRRVAWLNTFMRGMMPNRVVFAMLAPLVLASTWPPAFALDNNESHWCRNGAFAEADDIRLMRVSGRGRTYLHWDGGARDGCSDSDACRNGFVLEGQEALVGNVMDRYACAYYPQCGSAGWVERSALQSVPAHAFAISDWPGHWAVGSDDKLIDISERDLGIRENSNTARAWRGQNSRC